jgi:outer membrane protein assembly complex protein YaeT
MISKTRPCGLCGRFPDPQGHVPVAGAPWPNDERPRLPHGRSLRLKRARAESAGILLAAVLAFAPGAYSIAWTQQAGSSSSDGSSLSRWEGSPVRSISIEGIALSRLVPLAGHLAQAEGTPLNRESLKRSLRQLFATGLFENIEVQAKPLQNGVALVFHGTPRTFIGTVSVDGAKGATLNTQLERASQLAPGARFTQAKMATAQEQMRLTLAQNGFNEPAIAFSLTPHPEEQLVDIAFHVVSGPQARVGAVEVAGDAEMSVEEFRRHAHLRTGAHVDHETANRALAGVLKDYQKQDRLEAEIKLESQKYIPASNRTDYRFSATRGPVVKVQVEGATLSAERVKHVIPVFEEGTVDDDLLNEGNRRLRDYYQRLGYFDVTVDHRLEPSTPGQVVIQYKVVLGGRRRVQHVSVAGNRYFDAATLQQLLTVRPADTFDHHGIYSQALVSADVNALQAVYQNNGFAKVKVTAETSSPEAAGTAKGKTAGTLDVVYHIEEGQQLRVGTVRLEGNEHVDAKALTPQFNTTAGQLLSPQNLAGDRDALLTDYYSRGFDKVRVDVSEHPGPGDAAKVDVVFHITEGQQVFVRKVLLTGIHFTRPQTVAQAITLHPGDPLNLTALAETQRNFYEFALFNEVGTAVENPSGGETYKTILLQAQEARRWALTYGGGFEAQTGTPQNDCGSALIIGEPCNPNGKTGVSPRVLANLTRNNLFGRELSASLQGTYGLLEQKIDLLFQDPRFQGNRNFGLTVSGGYANSKDVTTYVASRLQAGVRLTEHFSPQMSGISKANTLVYEYNFRRVKVAQDSLQVGPFDLVELSTAVRVAGPGLTWIRDTRDSPLDSHRGTYTSFQEFLSAKPFGAETSFNRFDVSNSSYYGFDKGRFVVARNSRYGQERAFGGQSAELIPLPERLYAGGPVSLRGFPVNAAGPRDPETGYPIGGTGALVNSTELRLPPPTLPWVGDTLSLVLFHDMGNVFANAHDAWASALRVRQPDRSLCMNLTNYNADPQKPPPIGPTNSTGPQGACSFNYFSHAPGMGLRYHTPVGPVRLDFSYNLNTPIYPVIYNYSLSQPGSQPHVGEARHFNFFFSLGETF